jgi:hypothetical protein
LDAQADIVKSEKDIPVTKKELVSHNRNKWLKAVMGDIKVTTMIPKSIDCGANRLRQLSAKMQNSQATWRRPAKKLGQTSRLPSISVQLEDGAPGMQIGSFVIGAELGRGVASMVYQPSPSATSAALRTPSRFRRSEGMIQKGRLCRTDLDAWKTCQGDYSNAGASEAVLRGHWRGTRQWLNLH